MLYRLIDLFNGAVVPLLAVLLYCCAVKKAGFGRTARIVLFTLYLAGVFDLVGIPYARTAAWNPILNPIPFSDLFREDFSFWSIFQFAANIALFVPFGIFLPWIWKSFRRLLPTLLAGALLSCCIEFAQLFSARVSAVDDLLMNAAGTLIGYLLIAVLSKRRWKTEDAETKATERRERIELVTVTCLVLLSTLFVKYTIGELVYGLPLFQ